MCFSFGALLGHAREESRLLGTTGAWDPVCGLPGRLPRKATPSLTVSLLGDVRLLGLDDLFSFDLVDHPVGQLLGALLLQLAGQVAGQLQVPGR